MTRREAVSTRLYSVLARALLRTWDASLIEEATDTFRELERDARRRGRKAHLAFLATEIRSLLSTAARGGWRGPHTSLGPRTSRPRVSTLAGTVGQDLRYAVRNLARSPGMVIVTVLSLALAIGVSTVVFSVVNAVLLRPMPYVANPEELVRVFSSTPRYPRGPNSYPDFEDYRSMSRTLDDMAAVGSRSFSVGDVSGGTRQVWGHVVSPNYFQFLGIPLAMGRGFLPEDVDAGGRVVVIGHNTWQQELGGDPNVLGKTLPLDGHAYTVVGVGPPGMVSVDGPLLVEITVPLVEHRDHRGRQSLTVLGRLREGVGLRQAQAEFDVIAGHLAEAYPELWARDARDRRGLTVLRERDARIPNDTPVAAVFGGIAALVGLIMLIACSNVANLLLTRAFRRRREIAIRSAMGASARRIVAQLLTENLVLFGAAGLLGLAATQGIADVVRSGWYLLPAPGAEISVDGRVAAFTLLLTLGTGLGFGLIPALQTSRPDLIPALKGAVPSLRFRLLGMRNLLVGAQVGGSLVMILLTLLLVQSLSYAKTVPLGFDPTGIATVSLDTSPRGYGKEGGAQFYADLMARTAALDGVEGVGLADWVPLQGGSSSYAGLEPEGYEPGPGEYVTATAAVVTPGYLSLTRMRLLEGRDFGGEDTGESPQVALVNRSFVDRYWPGESGIGKQIGLGDGKTLRVVGIVADVPYRTLGSEVEPHMWLPLGQHPTPELVLHARTRGDPGALLALMRQQVADLDPNLPIKRADLMANISANATRPQRILSVVLGAGGVFALVLAMLGIYGVVAYSVSQRTQEMGMRLALGAEPAKLVRMVVGEGVVLSLIGLVPGLLAVLAASRLLRSVLLGLDPLDPLVFGTGVGILVTAVVAASLTPGLRAARADIMDTLRAE